MSAEIHIGTQAGTTTPGWAILPDRHASIGFPDVYARAFDTVEVDSTFYASPAATTIRSWYDRTPRGFIFALKLPQEITHEQRLHEHGTELVAQLAIARKSSEAP